MKQWLKWASNQVNTTFKLCMGFSFLFCTFVCVASFFSDLSVESWGLLALLNALSFTAIWSCTFLFHIQIAKLEKRLRDDE